MSIFAIAALPALRARPLLFLDFEASSLSPASWPVELGYAWIERGRVRSRATLIAPRADWSMDDWSDVAARVHGIPLAAIRAGAPADAVAAETDRFAGFEVVSENPAWEQRWLDRLRGERTPHIAVRPLRAALRERLDDAGASAAAAALFRSGAPHRAGPDAERMARAWLIATRAFGLAA
jgi:DNA polymerase-3 subunit epsilon